MPNSLRLIEKAATKIAPGRAPLFIEAHLVKALATIGAEGSIGRLKLAKVLGLGEGTTRTLIKHLGKEELITTSKTGIALADEGRKLWSSLKSRISQEMEIPKSTLTVGSFNVAILVHNAGNVIKAGLEQRDAAIKVGALGATTLIFSHAKLTMPSAKEDVFKKIPAIRKQLVFELKPQENDVIIIGTANDKSTAELGAIAAALETLKALKLR